MAEQMQYADGEWSREMSGYTPGTHRMRDAVANSDWMDAGRVTPETIQEGYATFDRWLASVKAKAWDEGYFRRMDDYPFDPEERDNPYRKEQS